MVGPRVILLSAALAPVPPHAPPAWQWPLRPPPRVVRGFSPPAHPWEAGHRGVDLAARPGRPVYAAGSGRVGFAGDLAGRAVVTIVHGALRTTYLPVRPSVHAGQLVQAGDRIGVVDGGPGHCADQSCLHWGLLRGTAYLDPLGLLGLGPVRLLPWWPADGVAGPTRPAAPYAGAPPTADRTVPFGAPGPGPPSSSEPDAVPPRTPTAIGRPPRAGSPGPFPGRGTGTGSARHARPSRPLTARLAGAVSPAGAGSAAGVAALAALVFAPSFAARVRRRLTPPGSRWSSPGRWP